MPLHRGTQLAYRPEDLPALLKISRSLAYRLAGRIGVRLGRRLIVPRSRVDAWLAGEGGSSTSRRKRRPRSEGRS